MRRVAFAGTLTGIIVLTAACGSATPALPRVSPPTAAPNAGAEAVYLAQLERIDLGLVVSTERAIRRAKNICLDIEQGKDEATVVNNAVQRLSGGNATIDKAQAAQVVELARTHICSP
ncbi:MAG: DUF732 domain-containing protein [Pseudonocardiaceae bacterium]